MPDIQGGNLSVLSSLITGLGDSDFHMREESQRKLERWLLENEPLQAQAGRMLGNAAASGDLEVQVRARRLLEEWVGRRGFIKNGDFSEGKNGWAVVDENVVPDPGYPDFPRNSINDWVQKKWMLLDVGHGSVACLQQDVWIPDTAGVQLKFWESGGIDAVKVSVCVWDGNRELVIDEFNPVRDTPQLRTCDLSAQRGRRVTLRFRATSNGNNATFAHFTGIRLGVGGSE